MTDYKKKYSFKSNSLQDAFIRNGYVIIKDVIDKKIVNKLYNFCNDKMKKLEYLSKKKKIKRDYELWSIIIISLLEKSTLYNEYIRSPKIIRLLKDYLGPDICTLGYNSLWINNPSNQNPVINKHAHVDAWTGTSTNTVFFKLFLTDVDKYNGLTMYPGSNLQGMIPVKGRFINSTDFNIKFKPVNLDNLKKGDVVMWHALTLHQTTGQSNKKTRVSMTTRFTSTESKFSSQEKALGYETISVSPLNQIKRIIGNDQLFPLRTYNTFIGTDKRLSELYNQKTNYEIEKIKSLISDK